MIDSKKFNVDIFVHESDVILLTLSAHHIARIITRYSLEMRNYRAQGIEVKGEVAPTSDEANLKIYNRLYKEYTKNYTYVGRVTEIATELWPVIRECYMKVYPTSWYDGGDK